MSGKGTQGQRTGHYLPDNPIGDGIVEASPPPGPPRPAARQRLDANVTTSTRLRLQYWRGRREGADPRRTAMTDVGGTVLGLAPSASGAVQLGEQTGAPADTLVRLTWALDHHQPLPAWAQTVGPRTLVLIDEVGMVDTLTLNTAVSHIVDRGEVCGWLATTPS